MKQIKLFCPSWVIFLICQIILPQAYAEVDAKAQPRSVDTPSYLVIPPGQSVPEHIVKCLAQLPVTFCDQSGNCNRTGVLIVNKELVNDLTEVFDYMRAIKFPISKIVPASQ